MNEANFKALAGLIEELGVTDLQTGLRLAVFLAARGVLVPAALTYAECLTVLRESRDWERGWESLTRAALERIAKGDAA